jgi:hypothetical protein
VFLEEPALWPVLLAGLGALGAVLAWMLATALRSRNVVLLLGVAVLIVASGELVRRDLRGARPGLRGGLLLALWALAIAIALVAGRYGVL